MTPTKGGYQGGLPIDIYSSIWQDPEIFEFSRKIITLENNAKKCQKAFVPTHQGPADILGIMRVPSGDFQFGNDY